MAATSVSPGSPPITRITLPTCRFHVPDGSERVHLSECFPVHPAFPVVPAIGIHIFTFEACSGFTHVTARRIRLRLTPRPSLLSSKVIRREP